MRRLNGGLGHGQFNPWVLSPLDASGNGRTLTVNGSAGAKSGLTADESSRWGFGYDFTGATQFLSRVGGAGAFGFTTLSACVAFYADAPTVAIQQVIVTHAGSTRYFEIQFTNTALNILFTAAASVNSAYAPTPGLNRVWVSRDSGNNVRFRLNDNPVETATLAGAITAATSIRLGVDATGGEPFNGSIHECRLWNVAKTDALLDQVLSKTDTTYKRRRVGDEFACWFMEARST